MEGAPKMPSPEDKKKANEKLRRAGAILGAAVGASLAAASPVSKAMAAPEIPLATEKLVVRPEDINKNALKSEIDAKKEMPLVAEKLTENPETIDEVSLKADIEAGRAVFKIGKDGEINRIPGKKE